MDHDGKRENWRRFTATGRVEDYLRYARTEAGADAETSDEWFVPDEPAAPPDADRPQPDDGSI